MLQFRPPSSDLQGTRSNSCAKDIQRLQLIQVTEHVQGSIRDLGMHETQYTQAFHNGDESGRAVRDAAAIHLSKKAFNRRIDLVVLTEGAVDDLPVARLCSRIPPGILEVQLRDPSERESRPLPRPWPAPSRAGSTRTTASRSARWRTEPTENQA